MFAFCVADVIENKWWLVRDRCGIKPLFYSQIGNDFVFASSIKAITQAPGVLSRPEPGDGSPLPVDTANDAGSTNRV